MLLTLARTLVNTMHRMVYALLPVFARGVGVDLATFTQALTARSLLGAASPLIGFISDRRGRKFGILAGMTLFLLGTGTVILWPTFPALVAAMLLTTTGKYVLDPSIHALIGDQVRYEQRGRAIAIIEMGWSLSFIVGIPLAGFLIARGGWTAPFPLLTGLALIAIVILARSLPGSAPRRASAGLPHRPLSSLQSILAHPSAIAGLLVGVWISAGNEVVNIVFGVWLEGSFQLKVTGLGAASLVIGLSELAGEGLVGALTDRLGKTRAIVGGLILNSLMAVALPALGQTLPGAVAGLFLFYFTFEFTIVSTLPMMTEILPERRATLLAANIAGLSLGRALGAWVAPAVFAWGMLAVGLAAVGFNLLALEALRRVKIGGQAVQAGETAS